jgi:hypothetical protein
MICNRTVQIQIVPYSESEYKQTLRALRSALPSIYELIVTRESNLIRYSADEPLISYQEKHFKYAESVKGEAVYGSRVLILYVDQKGDNYLTEYRQGVLRQDSLLSDELIAYLHGASRQPSGQVHIFVERNVAPEMTDRLNDIGVQFAFIDYPQPTQTSDGLEDIDGQYRLVRQRFGLAKNAKHLAVGLGCALVVIAGLVTLNIKNEEPIETVKRVEYVTIDDFEDYRKAVSHAYRLESLTEPLVATWLTLKRMPDGWTFDGVSFNQGYASSTVFNKGTGSLVAMQQFIQSSHDASFLIMDGIQGEYGFSIPPAGKAWIDKSVSFDDLQLQVLELFTQMGAKIKTNITSNRKGFKTQKIHIDISEMSIHMPLEISEYLKNKPVFVNELKLTSGTSESTVNMSAIIEIIGS